VKTGILSWKRSSRLARAFARLAPDAETVQQFSLRLLGVKWRFAMSLWDAFIDDYERRRKNLLKRIQLMEARLFHTGNSELGRWITPR
jgi:hypothetical protein